MICWGGGVLRVCISVCLMSWIVLYIMVIHFMVKTGRPLTSCLVNKLGVSVDTIWHDSILRCLNKGVV